MASTITFTYHSKWNHANGRALERERKEREREREREGKKRGKREGGRERGTEKGKRERKREKEEGKEPQIHEDENKKTRMEKLKFIAQVSINACPKHD